MRSRQWSTFQEVLGAPCGIGQSKPRPTTLIARLRLFRSSGKGDTPPGSKMIMPRASMKKLGEAVSLHGPNLASATGSLGPPPLSLQQLLQSAFFTCLACGLIISARHVPAAARAGRGNYLGFLITWDFASRFEST